MVFGIFFNPLNLGLPLSHSAKKSKTSQSIKTFAKKDLINNYNKILIIEKKLEELDNQEKILKKSIKNIFSLPIELDEKIDQLFKDVDITNSNDYLNKTFIYTSLDIYHGTSRNGGRKNIPKLSIF